MHYKFEEVSQISKEVAGGWLCIVLNEKALMNEEDYSKRARTLLKGKKKNIDKPSTSVSYPSSH